MVCPVRKGRDGNGINDGRRDTGVAKVWNKENDHKCAVAAKDSEAQWQDVSPEKSNAHENSSQWRCNISITEQN